LPKQKAVARSVRLDADLDIRIARAAKERGFSSPSAFIRDAIHSALSGQENTADAAEQRMAASIDRVVGEIRKVRRVQQAAFAFSDVQVKMLLTCVAEPPKEIYNQAVARGKLRYDRFLKSVGMGMAGDSAAAMKELMDRGEEH
jgi:Arc/MetJ-type ribon-helix-helix transcriptional regulator